MAEILVVEDYVPMASVLARLLRNRGHRVTRELTFTGASQRAAAFDHAVLDIDLPDGNGVTLAEQLFAEARVKSVVFFTATREATLLARAAQLGRVIDKARGTPRLLECIDQLVALHAGHGPHISGESCPRAGLQAHSDIFALQLVEPSASPGAPVPTRSPKSAVV